MNEDLDNDPEVQAIDVRLYFDAELDREILLDSISEALQTSADMCDLISAYELVDRTAETREAVDVALNVSIDRCARCKVCDRQTDAIMGAVGKQTVPADEPLA